jgi:thiosulfate dehydrogenase
MARGVVLGIVGTLVVLGLGAYIGIAAGLMPANADGKPPRIERWVARTSLHATLAREAPTIANPVALNDANLIAGVKLYAANCAVCHGTADGKPSNVALGLYQKPPQLATDGVEDDPDGVTYWKINHGIRFTGMPAFGHALTDQQLWELTLFLKHMDSLPAEPKRVWSALRSEAGRAS